MNSQDRDDEPRDPHLVAALRHAPDHDAVPPAPLTSAILGHAERALRRPAIAAPSRWREAWVRLWQPAPMAAFGTLAMTTLVGVMWIGQELPEATPALRPAPAAAPAAERPASPVPGPAVETQRPARAAPEARVREQRAAESGLPALPSPSPSPRAVPQSTPAPLPPATAAPDAAVRQQPAPLEAEARRDSAAPSAARAPTSTPGLAGAGSPVGAASADALAKALADAAPAAPRARSERSSQVLGQAAAPNSPLAPATAELDATAGTDAERVRWRVAGGRLVAHGPLQREGWTALANATQGRWQPVAPAPPADAAEAPGLVLLIDGAPRGVLVFEAQALVWRDARGTVWRAPLAAQTLLDWRETLARW